jgi:hypothetical protein
MGWGRGGSESNALCNTCNFAIAPYLCKFVGRRYYNERLSAKNNEFLSRLYWKAINTIIAGPLRLAHFCMHSYPSK